MGGGILFPYPILYAGRLPLLVQSFLLSTEGEGGGESKVT